MTSSTTRSTTWPPFGASEPETRDCRLARRTGSSYARQRRRGRIVPAMDRVIFACRHNAGGPRWPPLFSTSSRIRSAPARCRRARPQPNRLHPEVAEVMGEVGVDLGDAKPQRLTTELAVGATLLVTKGSGAARFVCTRRTPAVYD